MRVRLSILVFLASAVAASAAPITYTHTGFGSGAIGFTSFGATAPVAFTIRAVGDTDKVASCGGPCLVNDNISASIEITGLGTFDILTPTQYFSNNGLVGLIKKNVFPGDLFYAPPIASWDMVTSIGPIAGIGRLRQWSVEPRVVANGSDTLWFSDSETASTFTAVVGRPGVPEPTTMLLMAAGLGALVIRRRLV